MFRKKHKRITCNVAAEIIAIITGERYRLEKLKKYYSEDKVIIQGCKVIKSSVLKVNFLGYWGSKKIPVKVHTITASGAVASYSKLSENEGCRYFPLIVKGKNIEPFKLAEEDNYASQISMF